MAKTKENNATLVGIFFFIGLLTLGIMIAKFSNITSYFDGDYELNITFPDASGLVKDSDVTFGGSKIGRVLGKPILQKDRTILIKVKINGDVQVPVGSEISIYSVSLLGDKAVAIQPIKNPNGEFYEPGDFIKGKGSAGFEEITAKAGQIADNANEAINDFRKMATKLDSSLKSFDNIIVKTNEALEHINSDLLNKGNTQNISEVLANAREATATLKKLSPILERIDPFIAEAEEAIATVKKATLTAEGTFAKVSSQIDNVGPSLAELPKTLKNFQKVSDRAYGLMNTIDGAAKDAQKVIQKVENGDGVLSALTTDSELKE
ncbi:MlaD family protein, partial [Akkermansiaceae bacterium]|nr:MlaD family protein [Akkermansiaceae bacterium]